MSSSLILEDVTAEDLPLKQALTNAGAENPVHTVANGPHAIAFLRGVFRFTIERRFL
jgi:hypothetical protein